MQIPESMKEELQAWNNGAGIDLDGWISCMGNYSLSIGYASLFCPEFVEFEDYLFLGDEMSEKAIDDVRVYEAREGITPMTVEWVMNHFHIEDIHCGDYENLTLDKILVLGESLKKTYEARLNFLFPNKLCIVKFYKPEDPNNFREYQLSFWQKKHDPAFS